jgi:GntR family transcriptional regulator
MKKQVFKNQTDPDSEGIVDRLSHEPAYIQICNLLKERIAKGVYLPGSRLPAESELKRLHKVSPMTVRRSIKMLVDQGVVTTIQGSGTFVKAPDLGGANFSMKEFYSIFKDRKKAKIKLLEAGTLKADKETAFRLRIEEGKRIVLLKRLVLKEGDPIIFHREFLIYDPVRPIIETELEVTTLYGLFERSGQTAIKRGDLSLEAMVLNPEEARLLNTMPLLPAFRIEHLFYDFDEKPLSWGQFICRGDQLRFKAVVGLSPAL